MSKLSPFNLIRKKAGVENNCPVVITEGAQSPRLVGRPAYWKKGNHIIHSFPKYPGYTYHCSTRHVKVGYKWVTKYLPEEDVIKIVLQNMDQLERK